MNLIFLNGLHIRQPFHYCHNPNNNPPPHLLAAMMIKLSLGSPEQKHPGALS